MAVRYIISNTRAFFTTEAFAPPKVRCRSPRRAGKNSEDKAEQSSNLMQWT